MPLAAGFHIVANSGICLPEELWPNKQLGRAPVQEHARIIGLTAPLLELEPSSQLHLPLAEEGAVSTGNATETAGATTKRQR